jgi:hypothetical protein
VAVVTSRLRKFQVRCSCVSIWERRPVLDGCSAKRESERLRADSRAHLPEKREIAGGIDRAEADGAWFVEKADRRERGRSPGSQSS